MADAAFVPAAHIAARFPSASSLHAASGSGSSSGAGARVDEDELAQIAAANARFTQPLNTALSILKTSVVGAADARHVPDASGSRQPWRPLERDASTASIQLAASSSSSSSSSTPDADGTRAQKQKHPRIALPSLAGLPAGFPIDFQVSRNGQNLRDLLRRDYKEVQMHLPSQTSPFGIGFASVPLSMARLLTKDPTPGAPLVKGLIDAESRSTDRWHAWWYSIAAWMKERGLGMMVVGTSYRDDQERHKRELIVAYAPSSSLPPTFWSTFCTLLLHDAHVPDHSNASASSQRLLLESDWKGELLHPVPPEQASVKAVLKVADKRERVGGLDAMKGGLWDSAAAGRSSVPSVKAVVWKQANDKANRKIFLPAITWSVTKATST